MAADPLTPAQEKLVLEHLGLVEGMARRHRNWPSPDRPAVEDLVAEGNLALCRAAQDYDPARGEFQPHAATYIHRAFVALDRSWAHPVRIPREAHNLIARMRAAQRAGAATQAEVAAETGIAARKVAELWAHLATGASGLEAAEHVGDGTHIDESVAEADEADRARQAVRALPSPAREVIEARFGWTTGTPMLADEIADLMGIPAAQVYELEAAAMERVREELA